MKLPIDVPRYNPSEGFTYPWEVGFSILVTVEDGVTRIQVNKAGLLSLANQLLNLAQDGIPTGVHVHLHLDELNSLEESSSELLIEKV